MNNVATHYSPKNNAAKAVNISPLAAARDLVMAALVVWLTCPYQAFFSNWYLYGALWILWIGLAFLTDNKSFIYMLTSKYTLAAFLWPCSILFLSLFGRAAFSPYQFTIVFVISAFIYYAKGQHVSALKFLIAIYLTYSVLISANSILELRINPEISRILAQSDKEITIAFASPFMANFSFVNNATLIALFLTFFIKCTNKSRLKLLGIVLLVLNVVLLIMAQYSIALFLFVAFFMIVVLFYGKTKRSNRRSIAFVMICLSCIALLPFVGNILIHIAENMTPGYVERRLLSIGEMLSGKTLDSGSDLVERMKLYYLSISTFFHNFFIGVGGAEFGAGGLVGAHSQILDNFAYYGIFFGTQFVWYLICVYKNGASLLENSFKKIYRLIFTVYFLQCLLNTSYNEEMLFIAFFIIPSMIFLAQHKHNLAEARS